MDHDTTSSDPAESSASTNNNPTPSSSQQAQVKTRRQVFFENLFSLAGALLIVFMIRSSVVEAFKIPSGSMIPTLFIGDHIFVNKFAYGFKLPFSDLFTDHPIYLIKGGQPKHGDIIVFNYPRDTSIYFIKRVIGVPGDTDRGQGQDPLHQRPADSR